MAEVIQEDVVNWLLDYLKSLRDQHFYGKLIIDIRKGEIFLMRKEETIKPPENT